VPPIRHSCIASPLTRFDLVWRPSIVEDAADDKLSVKAAGADYALVLTAR
jgi:hypothetical protein